jgi:hypothetical protein
VVVGQRNHVRERDLVLGRRIGVQDDAVDQAVGRQVGLDEASDEAAEPERFPRQAREHRRHRGEVAARGEQVVEVRRAAPHVADDEDWRQCRASPAVAQQPDQLGRREGQPPEDAGQRDRGPPDPAPAGPAGARQDGDQGHRVAAAQGMEDAVPADPRHRACYVAQPGE